MKKIGRPRKANRKENISVNLDKSLLARIEDELSWKTSRSVWISTAIKYRLDRKLPDIDELRLETLVWTVKNHKDCPDWLVRECNYYLDTIAKTLSGETAE